MSFLYWPGEHKFNFPFFLSEIFMCALVCVFLAYLLVCKPLLSHVVESGLPQASLHVLFSPFSPFFLFFFLSLSFSLLLFCFYPSLSLTLCTCTQCSSPSCSHLGSVLLAGAHVALGMSSETLGPHLTCKSQAGPRPGKTHVARS